MYFFTTGKAAMPIHFDSQKQEARFTLRDKNNRFFVVTTSVEQYVAIRDHSEVELLIIGSVFSFRCIRDGCNNFRVGFKPMLLLPLNGNIDQAEQVAVQLIKYSLREHLPLKGD